MTQDLRIVSFLPAATEMVALLGLEDKLVGTSHECNFPPSIRSRPVVVKHAIDTISLSPAAVDAAISGAVRQGEQLYMIDEELLAELRPTLLLVQDVCQVCAPSGQQLQQVVQNLKEKPRVLSLSPQTLTDIAQNLRDLGHATGTADKAEEILADWKTRMADVQRRVNDRPRVRCFVFEWIDPIYCSGHWVAEMVQLAGGYDLLARPGQASVRVSWEEVVASAPDVLILSPCGYSIDEASDQLAILQALPGWEDVPAVRSKRVYAVNADAFVTRPGPRIVDGIEMLAYLLHAE